MTSTLRLRLLIRQMFQFEKLILKTRNSSHEGLISLMKDIIALSDTYGRLLYLSDKKDVIGIASVS